MTTKPSVLVPILTLIVAAACVRPGSPPSGNDDGAPSHGTSAGDIVMLVEVKGGLLPPSARFTSLPQSVLYGDGVLVFPGPQIEIFPPPALPNLQSMRVDELWIRKLLQDAEDAGFIEGDKTIKGPDTIADAPTTFLTIVADGRRSVTQTYALGIDEESGERAKMRKFIEKYTDPGAVPKVRVIEEERAYDFTALQLSVEPASPPDPQEEPQRQEKQWPLSVPAGQFGEPVEDGSLRCGGLEGEDARTMIQALRDANSLTIWISEGQKFSVYPRPVLPGEKACRI